MIFNVQWISLINSQTLINSLPNSPAITHYHKCQLNGVFLLSFQSWGGERKGYKKSPRFSLSYLSCAFNSDINWRDYNVQFPALEKFHLVLLAVFPVSLKNFHWPPCAPSRFMEIGIHGGFCGGFRGRETHRGFIWYQKTTFLKDQPDKTRNFRGRIFGGRGCVWRL